MVTICTTQFNIQISTFCPHFIYVFCIYIRTNSDICPIQHLLIGFYNRDEKCLLRGTDWVFKYNWLVGFYNRDEKCLLRVTDWVFKYSSGVKNFPKIHKAPQNFRHQNGVSRQRPYWGPKILDPTVQYLDATTTLFTRLFFFKGLTNFLSECDRSITYNQ